MAGSPDSDAAPGDEIAGDASRSFELKCGVTIAVFAAILAITDIGGRHYSAESLIANNEKATAYQWYQAKAVRQTVVEAEVATLKVLMEIGAVREDRIGAVEEIAAGAYAEAERYEREKAEILSGSDAVGEANWAQDFNGEMGQIVGANEWDGRAKDLGEAGHLFNLSTLLLQFALVLGPISLIAAIPILRKSFMGGAMAFGLGGSIASVIAHLRAFSI